MTTFFSSIRSVKNYSERTDILRVRFLYNIEIAILIMVTIFGIVGMVNAVPGTPELPIVAAVVVIGVYGLTRAGYLQTSAVILLAALAIIMLLANIQTGVLPFRSMLIGAMLIALAGFYLGRAGILFFTVVAVAQVLLFPEILGYEDQGYALVARVPLTIIYLVLGFVIDSFNAYIEASRLTGQDIESVERLKLAEVNARITRQASARESLDTALNTTLQLILDNYEDVYHAQVFLIDEDGIAAQLAASTGEAGQKLMARNHSLAVGSLSVIGQTTLAGEPVVAISGDKDNVHRVNELLPDTKLEAAFPLRVGENIIGALDLQSKTLETLNNNDRLTFQSLANSLSLAIDSIRQFDRARARVEENQRLAEQTRTALREVERLNRRLIGRAWAEYVKGVEDNPGYEVNFATDKSEEYQGWTPTLADAARTNNLVQDNNVISVPLRVRGQVIGAMEFELEDNQDFTPEDLELVTEVSERFGLAAENTRLVEESQRTAQRETLINQMTSSFQSAQNVEATLAEAARSLGEILHADNVKIRLGVPQQSSNGTTGSNGKDS